MMKNIIYVSVFLIILGSNLFAQSISLEECYQSAEKNYPLNKQRDLLAKSKDFNISNAVTGYFPKINISGTATYQSDVPHLNINMPGINIPSPDKFQYKAVADINQTIYDGGIISQQNDMIKANYELEIKKLEVELYKVKERITDIYFGILMLQAQTEQNELYKKDLQLVAEKVQAQVNNGVVLKSNLSVLQAEILKARQREIEMEAGRKAYIAMLAQLTGISISENATPVKPPQINISGEVKRPEIDMFKLQSDAAEAQRGMISAKNLPKINAFLQGGYGKPALNLFKNEGDFFYITGVSLVIPISGYYNQAREYELLNLNKLSTEVMKETFLFNTQLEINKQKEDIKKFDELLQTDNEIIQLRESITAASKAQLENGVINSNDYLRELNAQEIAKQNKIMHELQLLLIKYKNKITTGN